MRTTKTFYGLIIGATVMSVLFTIQLIVVSQRGLANINIGPRTLASMGANALLIAIALGGVTMAGESRHHTEGYTFLTFPNRTLVVLAKAVTAFVGGVIMAIVAEVAILAIGI